jgi:signal transduction histidine kinase
MTRNKKINFALDRETGRQVLQEQLLWMIKIRWLAAAAVICGGLIGTSLLPILADARKFYICGFILFALNLFYYLVSTKKGDPVSGKDILLAMAQVEIDLIMLTVLLHFSGGIMNPFVLFYVFHVIIATIILPRTLSSAVGVTAIFLYGFMALGEYQGWSWLGFYPLQLDDSGNLVKNPVYVLWVFVAFVAMVNLAQYLTRTVINRMRAKELEAARNHDVLMAVINAMSEGLLFLNSEGKIALCNRAARLWVQDIPSDSLEYSLDNFPEDLAQHLKKLISTKNLENHTGEIIKFGSLEPGQNYIEAKSCPVEGIDRQPLGYVVVGQDLTEHKKMERDLRNQTEEVTKINEMLRKSQIEMAQREKLAAIGQMSSGIAHEIGNPLASLSSVVQYLDRKSNDPQIKQQLGLIERQVNRISGILKRLLGISRPAGNEFTWCDVNRIVEDTLSLVRYDKRARSVDIDFTSNHDLPTVWLKQHNLEQVLLNAILNSLDAMNAEQNNSEPHRLEINSRLRDGKIELRISDTGIGISPQAREHVFEPFFTTKEQGKGTGLGLYISRNLIEEIGGALSLESHGSQGTVAIIKLPAQAVPSPVTVNEGK